MWPKWLKFSSGDLRLLGYFFAGMGAGDRLHLGFWTAGTTGMIYIAVGFGFVFLAIRLDRWEWMKEYKRLQQEHEEEGTD
jgi:hypothetical protein